MFAKSDSVDGLRRLVLSRDGAALLAVIVLQISFVQTTCAAVTATGNFFPDPLVDGAILNVGSVAHGTFRIDGGSTFSSQSFTLGESPQGVGTATITGAGSKWTFNNLSTVGASGLGRLEVRQGAVVEGTGGGGLRLGTNSPGHGTVVVDGAGSLLHVNGQLMVGNFASTGVLEISNDAVVNVPIGPTQVNPASLVRLGGGYLRTQSLENRGIITGSGAIDIQCCGSQENQGRIDVGSGDHLILRSFQGGEYRNRGELTVDGGELEIQFELRNDFDFNNQSGLITLRNGTLRVGLIGSNQNQIQLANAGLVAAIGGENHILGTVENQFEGQIAVTNNSLLMFHHDVRAGNNSTISVFAGSTAIFLQDLNVNGGTLLADLTGTAGYGHVEVVGDFFFNGNLQVNLAANYTPQIGDSFPLVTTAGTVDAFPNLDQMPELPGGLGWQLGVQPHQMVLSVIAAPQLPGDYNGDGVVDTADYVVWRNTLDQMGVGLAADGDGNQFIDEFDYEVWRANFGRTAQDGGGAASPAPVPEPSTGLLAALACAACLASQRRAA